MSTDASVISIIVVYAHHLQYCKEQHQDFWADFSDFFLDGIFGIVRDCWVPFWTIVGDTLDGFSYSFGFFYWK